LSIFGDFKQVVLRRRIALLFRIAKLRWEEGQPLEYWKLDYRPCSSGKLSLINSVDQLMRFYNFVLYIE
jgi:hypothetical protein